MGVSPLIRLLLLLLLFFTLLSTIIPFPSLLPFFFPHFFLLIHTSNFSCFLSLLLFSLSLFFPLLIFLFSCISFFFSFFHYPSLFIFSFVLSFIFHPPFPFISFFPSLPPSSFPTFHIISCVCLFYLTPSLPSLLPILISKLVFCVKEPSCRVLFFFLFAILAHTCTS